MHLQIRRKNLTDNGGFAVYSFFVVYTVILR